MTGECDVRNPIPLLMRCPACAHEFSCTSDTAPRRRCPACGRRVQSIDWSRRLRRAALIVFGVSIQVFTGIVAYLIPPGPSVLAWSLYLGLGVIGFLHIFIGLEMKRSPDERAARRAAREQRQAAAPEADELIDARCPNCREDLALALAQGTRRCFGCRRVFSLREFGVRGDDPAGELAQLAPAEVRLSGRGGAIVIALVVIAVIGLSVLIGAARAGNGIAPRPAPQHQQTPTAANPSPQLKSPGKENPGMAIPRL